MLGSLSPLPEPPPAFAAGKSTWLFLLYESFFFVAFFCLAFCAMAFVNHQKR